MGMKGLISRGGVLPQIAIWISATQPATPDLKQGTKIQCIISDRVQ